MLGRIIGKATTLQFSFELQGSDVRKFEYVKVMHRVYGWVLCQAVEIEVSHEHTVARCNILGYKDEEGKVRQIRIPFDIGTEVFLADDSFIADIIQLGAVHVEPSPSSQPAVGQPDKPQSPDKIQSPDNTVSVQKPSSSDKTAQSPKVRQDSGAYIGLLDGKGIPVRLDLGKLLTKHVTVLAKSGAGKSYAVGVLIEEILEHKVPVLVIDPHGEYGLLREKNTDPKDVEAMARFKIKPTAYKVKEYGDANIPGLTPLRLPNNLTQPELLQLLPGKLNNTQLGILYGAIKGIEQLSFESVLMALEAEESSAKWAIINLIEHLRSLNIFSSSPVPYNEMIRSGVCSVINLKGYPPEIQEVIVYKLAKDLFELRKVNKVPPFFLVVEEAHNYCPERSFGEATSSKILRTIASEGRKFGLGLCVISQRPARVDKSVLSQCTTHIILKVTNPNDLKAVGASVEGLTSESEGEIQNLPIGTALVTGVVDMPLFVNVRPRRTQHGGHAVDILDQPADFLEQTTKFEDQSLLPLVKPKTTPQDLATMAVGKVKEVRTMLIPAYLFACQEKESAFKILMDMTSGEVVVDVEDYLTAKLPELKKLTAAQLKVLQAAHTTKSFTKEEIVKKANTAMEIGDDLADLVKKGYLELDAKTHVYTVTTRFILTKLSKHTCHYPVNYESISYTAKLESRKNLDTIKEALARFTTVLDQQECNVVRYEIVMK
jgi:uncharacterized protein